ncbi:U4/U6 snRNA-associated-splicing factor PRP24 [Pleurostoma richardsiae]|uniref:U4/U6 snRNA-associated-splicing factor PRP24 n=1 Tax=Pleurostoma richardsiae TaxID=41990 RepID=A0AA38VWW4_9PEZI|nr:U4/U6 snRNA-associated-splicing factor PRP24 [Pleurostoma richardsiae]
MASNPPPPVGEDAWVALAEEQARRAHDLLSRIEVLELLKQAVSAEPDSIKTWVAYCEYFWSLRADSQPQSNAGWSPEEQAEGRELFTLDAALNLWQQGYEATRYRLNDSHELWNRWVSVEMELLSQTRTPEGVKRITHLFRDRLQTPHLSWDETSQMFSTFLSEYNRAAYESTMQQVTHLAEVPKKLVGLRDSFETKLAQAARAGDVDAQKAVMIEYLDWEMRESAREKKHPETTVKICLGLYSRALTGLFARDDGIWTNYIVWVSSMQTLFSQTQAMELLQVLPNSLDILQRAVQHCPWAGNLWARYILSAEEAGLSFPDVERIKHGATDSSQLDKHDMTGVLEMYAAWCGFLRRRAMNVSATDEDVDIADLGLVAALEDVQIWGNRKYGEEYKGDPDFRLERILIQYLTEKKGAIDEAREQWEALAKKELYANSYDFWLKYYMWEMMVFQTQKFRRRSPTPSPVVMGIRVPHQATAVLLRAVKRRQLDWPERVMEIYLQHCNDYETPETLRRANDTVHKARKGVAKRRAQEAAAAAAAYGTDYTQYQQQAAEGATADMDVDHAASAKRKREGSADDAFGAINKRFKSEEMTAEQQEQQRQKRDRENTSILVSNIPVETTLTKIRQFFREYGHVKNIIHKVEKDGQSQTAVIEFDSPEEVKSALLRDGKFFGQQQISVRPATGLTLFVANYPPHADEAYIRDIFKGCGEVLSVRFPSLKFNTHRRFCYVTFHDADASAKATRLDGTELEGKFKLVAKYSDPGSKKQRDGAIEEGREVHVTNVPFDAKEDDVKAVFERYGTVERVRIPRTKEGKSRGTAFVVYMTKEQAEAAISELNNTKFRSQILKVELSRPVNFKPIAKTGPEASASPSPGPSGVKDAEGDEGMPDRDTTAGTTASSGADPEQRGAGRSFALMGIPDTVNDVRVRALVEPHTQVISIVLHPSHGGAIINCPDATSAGKAQLALEGSEIGGHKLRTGSVKEMLNQRAKVRIDRVDRPAAKSSAKKSGASAMMPPPPMVRRPVLGKVGGKQRAGFPSAAGKDKGGGVPNGTAPAPTDVKRSNADFRALFLNKGEKKDEGKEKSSDQAAPAITVAVSQNGSEAHENGAVGME